MFAYFYKDKFFAFWQDQELEVRWVERTTQALGHDMKDVIVRKFPQIRNDQSHFFDKDKNLILLERVTEEIDGEKVEVNRPGSPIPGKLIFGE